MLCLCYLDLEGGISHLRYLLRRLRRVLPNLPILVGIWPKGATAVYDERVRVAIGADHYITSLQEAVETCVGVVQRAEGAPAPPIASQDAAPSQAEPESPPLLRPQDQPQPQLP
jgi:hypothetical protein